MNVVFLLIITWSIVDVPNRQYIEMPDINTCHAIENVITMGQIKRIAVMCFEFQQTIIMEKKP